ncbi:MAG TPA: hypothetical protein VM581_01715 [Magnetospirillaceae bacterium]|nr:hypothetical protein [Magnetospirillaceae bacterium]
MLARKSALLSGLPVIEDDAISTELVPAVVVIADKMAHALRLALATSGPALPSVQLDLPFLSSTTFEVLKLTVVVATYGGERKLSQVQVTCPADPSQILGRRDNLVAALHEHYQGEVIGMVDVQMDGTFLYVRPEDEEDED